MSRRDATADGGPFRARTHTGIPGHSASIYRDGEFFIADLEAEAAKRLAALLNDAEAVANLIADGRSERHGRDKVAFAVAKAMGRLLDFSEVLP